MTGTPHHRPPHATVSPSAHLTDEITALLLPLRKMQRRHQAELDLYRTADGEVIDERYADYDDARQRTAMEAGDALDTLLERLENLVAVPSRRPFTVAVQGPGHEEGAAAWLFVVTGTSLDDAHRALTRLPSFQQWQADIRPPDGYETPGDAQLVPGQSHPGTRESGSYIDLRHEQAHAPLRRTTSPAPASPGPRPSCGPPRRPR
ncbi:hypothetical protein ABZ370_31645 [Streptomyces sp. NPDC005962]|uniref:hypothetical protein n=1 Tax=Streptomyces sp. NPDC005962 TaxID=3154466 RepID=UPI0033CA1750